MRRQKSPSRWYCSLHFLPTTYGMFRSLPRLFASKAYNLPSFSTPSRLGAKTAALIASGDSRLSANLETWSTQKALEAAAADAFDSLGWTLQRAHDEISTTKEYDGGHGFIASQAQGRDVFEEIHPEDPLVVAESVWQYSHHVLMGLQKHKGPILILANWDGAFPGLVGALSLRAGLTKAGVKQHSLLWEDNFQDEVFVNKLKEWCDTGSITHDLSHVQPISTTKLLPPKEKELGEALAQELRHRPAILGCFDEGCKKTLYFAAFVFLLLESHPVVLS
jgi:hypothetical protein